MSENPTSRLRAILLALLATALWSSSWVIIKFGLEDLPPLTFAGLRYVLAFLCLLPFALRPAQVASLRRLSLQKWGRLLALGLLLYAVTQSAQYLGLALLPTATVSLLLNFTTIVVVLASILFLAEKPTVLQWVGILVNLAGVFIYFVPLSLANSQAFGLIVVMTGVLANAAALLLGRRVNREGDLSPLMVTTVSMGAGSIVLLVTGILVQGLPSLTWTHWAMIAWLAVVNTALAFTLWNITLRTLSAMEAGIINSLMLVQIALLAWLFLGEQLTLQEWIGMALAGLGVLLVQLRRS